MMRALAAILAGLIFAGPVNAGEAVRVGAKLDSESQLLGQMIVLSLADKGIVVEDHIPTGPTAIVRSAVLSGAIDVYPEYTGNGALFFDEGADPVWKSPRAGYERIRELDQGHNDLIWLRPAPANNPWAIAVRSDVATAQGLVSMEDFGRWVNSGGTVRLAASAEFVSSPGALPSFQSVYGFKLTNDQIRILPGGDTVATIHEAAEGTSGINAAMVFGTDGAVAALGLVVLADTKGAQLIYQPAPVVRGAVLRTHPEIASVLNPVFASLGTETLRVLNARIGVEGENVRRVAIEYLTARGLIR